MKKTELETVAPSGKAKPLPVGAWLVPITEDQCDIQGISLIYDAVCYMTVYARSKEEALEEAMRICYAFNFDPENIWKKGIAQLRNYTYDVNSAKALLKNGQDQVKHATNYVNQFAKNKAKSIANEKAAKAKKSVSKRVSSKK